MQGGPRPDQAESVTMRPSNDPEWRWNPKAVEIQRCGDHDVGRVGEESSKLWKKNQHQRFDGLTPPERPTLPRWDGKSKQFLSRGDSFHFFDSW